jgi:hypothetical protein
MLLQGYLPGAARGLNAAAGATHLGSKRAPASQLNTPSPFLPAQQQQPLQVLLRVRVKKPNTHNTLSSLQVMLAGLSPLLVEAVAMLLVVTSCSNVSIYPWQQQQQQ